MRTNLILGSVMLMLVVGCGKRPSNPLEYDKDVVCRRLERAGYVAAIVGLKAAKVEQNDDVEKYAVVVRAIEEIFVEMPDEGLAVLIPAMKERIEKKFGEDSPNTLIGLKVFETLVEELEERFQKNPKWLDKRDDLAAMISSFLRGALDGIEAYGK